MQGDLDVRRHSCCNLEHLCVEFGVLASVLGSNASVARMMFCERCSENCGHVEMMVPQF